MELLPIRGAQATAPALKAYEAVLGALRRPGFEGAVVESFRASLSWERLYVFHGARIETAALRVARYEPSLGPIVPLYVREYMPRDPLRHAAETLDDRTLTVVLRLEPSDIAEEGYRRVFFEERGIVERVSVLQRCETGWRGVNIARHRRHGPCSEADISTLAGIAQLILPIVDHHFDWQASADWRNALSDMEVRFEQGFPALTERERQVCARAAVGMSIEATALDLGIGRSSVLTYRRRAYGRLHVTSPYGLAALVLH